MWLSASRFARTDVWTLYRPLGPSPEVAKILLTARCCGIDIDVKPLARIGVTHSLGQSLPVTSASRFPVLHMGRGQLFGSHAICRFLTSLRPSLRLHGASCDEQGQIDSWLEWTQSELEVPLRSLLEILDGPWGEQSQLKGRLEEDIAAAVQVLDEHLILCTFFVSGRLTLADLCAQAAVQLLLKEGTGCFVPDRHLNVQRWFSTIEAQLADSSDTGTAPCAATVSKDAKPVAVPKPRTERSKAKLESSLRAHAKADGSQEGVSKDHGSDTKGILKKKASDFPAWYTQVITKSEMIEYYDISGCYILRPWSFFMWQLIVNWVDSRIKKMGVENAYFPCFVSKDALEMEKDHVQGFAPEVAWVTKSGNSNLTKPIALRPTSETIMYPAFAKWIRSHRDLPMKINQWVNIVRWEFKQPTPFLRSREFLWQEGHTVHATREEAMSTVDDILDLYADMYEDLLAVPVIKGVKSEGEKFAGGQQTHTVEAFIPASGRGIQAATSHLLGNNFAKMFDITFEDEKGERRLGEQTSWGVTTRALGIMIMVHSDDKGLVLPPRVAPIQVIIIPIPASDSGAAEVYSTCDDLNSHLRAVGVRAETDMRPNRTPGWKYNWWEMKGVPIRVEVGPRDIERGTCRIVKRHTGMKTDCKRLDFVNIIVSELDQIHSDMFCKAREERDSGIVRVTRWSDVMPALNQGKLILAPWCETTESEDGIKKATRDAYGEESTQATADESTASGLSGAMKSLCIPLEQPPLEGGTKCFFSGQPARRWGLFGRSY